MENHGRTDGITDLFERALTSNGEALIIYNAMLPEERQKLRDRAARITDKNEMKALINDLVGWQEGHPHYQL